MAEKKMQAPQGMAGLVRYYDEDSSKFQLKPEHVLAICVGIIVLEAMMHAFA
ncbi:MAG: SEC61-beta family protein [Candidatus Aenigmarchaeota archaeon]|nr:SEC61-beta family protein [Candidatus Aenigmarchaeota archaeon]